HPSHRRRPRVRLRPRGEGGRARRGAGRGLRGGLGRRGYEARLGARVPLRPGLKAGRRGGVVVSLLRRDGAPRLRRGRRGNGQVGKSGSRGGRFSAESMGCPDRFTPRVSIRPRLGVAKVAIVTPTVATRTRAARTSPGIAPTVMRPRTSAAVFTGTG